MKDRINNRKFTYGTVARWVTSATVVFGGPIACGSTTGIGQGVDVAPTASAAGTVATNNAPEAATAPTPTPPPNDPLPQGYECITSIDGDVSAAGMELYRQKTGITGKYPPPSTPTILRDPKGADGNNFVRQVYPPLGEEGTFKGANSRMRPGGEVCLKLQDKQSGRSLPAAYGRGAYVRGNR